MGARWICKFSCGAASAVATKLTLRQQAGTGVEVIPLYSNPRSEHPDNVRFRADCERWFGVPVVEVSSDRYRDVDDVFERERFMVSHKGAHCTGALKREPANVFQRPDDVLVFGYTADAADQKRADRLRSQCIEPLSFPLIDAGLTKADCLAIIDRAGIKLPAMYLLGFRNNNCLGCVKGGMGYWNRTRVHFPQVFARRAAQQRALGPGAAFWREPDGTPITLDDLDPARGNHDGEPEIECSLMCMLAEQNIEAA